MRFIDLLATAAASAALAAAAPAVDTPSPVETGLRLVKTSEADPGSWVTEEGKDQLVADGIGFFDITDIEDEEVLTILSTPPSELRSLHRRQITYPTELSHQDRANCLIPRISTDGPQLWLKNMTEFWNRHYRSVNGTLAAAWMFELVGEIAGSNPLIEVTQFPHSAFDQPSVIARITGASDELVIVSAHFDSTGGSATARGPGADDNGSGVVVIMEALRIFADARYKPENTLEFHFFAGEEGGMLGSKDVFADYKAKNKTVLAMMNQDMAGYSPSGKISIFTDYADPGLTAYCRLIAEEYTGETTQDVCGYACSDHGSAYANGFPAAYVCDEPVKTATRWIHSPWDVYETIQWDAIHRHSVFTLLAYGALVVVYNLFFHPLRRFPGPKLWAASPLPAARNVLRGTSHYKILELHKRYGDIVRVGPNELAFAHADAWKDVCGHLQRGQDENGKDPKYGNEDMDRSLISASRERHGPMRRLLSHGFSARAMAEQQPLINTYIDLFLQRLRENGEGGSKPIDLTKWFEWATFDIIGDLSFGESFGCLQTSASHPWVDSFFESMKIIPAVQSISDLPLFSILKPLYFLLFIPKEAATQRRTSQLFAEESLKKRLSLTTERPDFVQAMLERGKEYRLTPAELRDNSVLLTTAGSETTATTLTAAVYFLGTHPEVLEKLKAEVRSSFKSEDEIDVTSVQNLSYMLAVLKEVMRVHPAVAISLPRSTPPGGAEIAGEHIPGNTTLGIWQYAIYHDPTKFLHPDSFIPERWLDDKRFENDAKHLHQPFSYGPRNCLGMNLAYAEMRLILARMIWNFDFELAPTSRQWAVDQKVFFFWEKPPLWVNIKKRSV
ncbi:trichothecene c-15 hydroxylase [Colletotrichum musicola]|uniref:Peptide hydrolase n=1 Tax=Colletotrichum musicola TaxID=2175873 RepID=A0A8H6KD81_9PEZI|nr:trichothecene c-15 hydroxylase [Colletotrichum musicola]